jgi:hypothetical protein
MAQTGNLAAFDFNEKAIVFNSLYAALDLLTFLEVRQ